ncbi:MAG: energy transducer TonB [Chitinophagales bacterium]|nr:energy transducer TonB [Chitinophagales bacterium]
MKQTLIFLTVMLFMLPLTAQDFFFHGEKSYPCTEVFGLQSNSGDSEGLQILFAKDGSKALIIVRKESLFELTISGKLIIYLEDGTVISCIDRGLNDYVDNIASSVYYLTDEELTKMANSNINAIRYKLEGDIVITKNLVYDAGGDYTASNKGSYRTNYPAVITSFFIESTYKKPGEPAIPFMKTTKPVEETAKPTISEEALFGGSAEGPNYQGQSSGSGNAGIGFSLSGRDMVGIPSIKDDSQKEGKVTLKIKVDRNGKVINAEYTIAGSTTSDPYLKELSVDAALNAKFNPDENAPEVQQGTMTFVFKMK